MTAARSRGVMPAGVNRAGPLQHADVFSSFLKEGENILWVGRPARGISFLSVEAGVIAAAVAFAAIFAFVAWTYFSGPANAWLAAAAGATSLVGFAAASACSLRSFSRRRALAYCLTNERALIVEAKRKKAWAWLNIDYDTPVAVTAGKRGRGTVSFGRRYDFDTEETPLFRGFTFYNISDAAQVVDHVERLQTAMRPTGGQIGLRRAAEAAAADRAARTDLSRLR